MALTSALGQFIADLSSNRVPDEAVRIARMGFIDCIGTMIVGRNEPCAQILKGVLAPGTGPATLYFSGEQSPGPEAGWINGTAAHALDYDDVSLRGHPSTVLVPAILAEAEVLGASGRDMLIAYIAGYETWAELVRRDVPMYHQKGFHPTGIFGAVGAAAACAKLRKLDANHTAIAIAIGASQSSGIMSNFGTMTKPFHAGKAAHSGIMAARLAEAGLTANTDALEHPQGFLSAVSPENNPDRAGDGELGEDWAIIRHGLSIKKYPACYGTHRAIDAMLDLVEAHQVKPEDVRKVSVHFSSLTSNVLRNRQPDTGLAAKFSMEFAMASGLIAHRVSLAELTDSFVQRKDVQDTMRLVERDLTDETDEANPGSSPWEQVKIELVSGQVLESERVTRARGHAERPLTDSQLHEKFEDCLTSSGSEIPADVLFGRLQSMQSISARELTAGHC
ncbi:MAG: MmgE/PrpD family protein [Gammaproteobacteria bacterium]